MEVFDKIRKSELGKVYDKTMDVYSMAKRKVRPYQVARFTIFGILEVVFLCWTLYLRDWLVLSLMFFDLALLTSNYFIRAEFIRRVSSSLPTLDNQTTLDAPNDIEIQTQIQSKFTIDEVDMWVRMMYIVISHIVGLGFATWSTTKKKITTLKIILKVFTLFVFPVTMNIFLPVVQYIYIVKKKIPMKTKEDVVDFFRLISKAYCNGIKIAKNGAVEYIEKKKEVNAVTIKASTSPNDISVVNYGDNVYLQ